MSDPHNNAPRGRSSSTGTIAIVVGAIVVILLLFFLFWGGDATDPEVVDPTATDVDINEGIETPAATTEPVLESEPEPAVEGAADDIEVIEVEPDADAVEVETTD